MRVFIIFVMLTISNYANITNLKTPLAGCNNNLSVTIGQPSCQGAFNFMKLIPLYNKKKEIVAYAKVDDSDYETLMKYKWGMQKSRHTNYARRAYAINGKNTEVKMHRVIMGITKTEIEVDHIDRDGLNNQRNNLREATRYQNKANIAGRGESKYLGVSRWGGKKVWEHKIGKTKDGQEFKKWEASIRYNGVRHRLGLFRTEEEAARAYDKKAKEFHGEFANLNFKE